MRTVLSLLFVMGLNGIAHAEGDADRGEQVFTRCVACHSVEPGQNRVGPSLHDIMDQPAANVEGFNYSPALEEAGLVWDDETMAEYLRDPRGTVPGTRMAFAGLRNDEEIADVIAYLRQFSED
jgi:cytochrome c